MKIELDYVKVGDYYLPYLTIAPPPDRSLGKYGLLRLRYLKGHRPIVWAKLVMVNGEGAKTEYTGITFAGAEQDLDTGFKVIHNAPNTSSVVNSKSISKDGGASTYRALVRVSKNAKGSKCSVSCESLMLDDISRSDTIPVNDIQTDEVEFSHEAKIGKISDKEIFYLMSRGLSEEDAKAMIVRGFAYPVSKELPVEYAVEMNNLINIELEGSIG